MKTTFETTKKEQFLKRDITDMRKKILKLTQEQELSNVHRARFLKGKIAATKNVINMYQKHIKENYTLSI